MSEISQVTESTATRAKADDRPVQATSGVEDRVTDEDRDTLPTEFTSEEQDGPTRLAGVSPPNAEAICPDWEHLGG